MKYVPPSSRQSQQDATLSFKAVINVEYKFASFNNYSLVYPLQNEVTALLFEGYSWASQVPLLTIVIIKDNKAKVVFNKSLAVSEFNAYSKGFELTLIDDFDNPDKIYKLYTTTEGLMSILEIE